MTPASSTDPRYPIGKFQRSAPITAESRVAAIDDIAALPAKLRAAVAGLTDAQLDTPYRDGGWTVRQLVHHVADSHINSYVRFRNALTETEPLIKTYEEGLWAELEDAHTMPVEVSLTLLEALHARWTVLLRSMDDAAFARTLRHPDLGPMNLDTMTALYAWHCRHHVAHVDAVASRLAWR